MLSRLPLRLKLTLAFAAVMAIVLAATGLFLYGRFKSQLTSGIDQGLRSRATDVTTLVQQADTGLRDAGRRQPDRQAGSFAQILDARGRVFDAPPQLRGRALLTRAELRRALAGTILVERPLAMRAGDESRLLATPVQAQDKRLVVIVGQSLDGRNSALGTLAGLLLIGGPVALLLASACGYGVASAALRSVEAMRRRAAAISEQDLGARLPVAGARDELSRLGQTLNQMLDRLERAFTRERAFLADASHELRSPIAILKAELELAIADRRSEEERRDAVGSAIEETDRLARLADDLLLIARSDQGRLPVYRADTELSQIFTSLIARFALRCREGDRKIDQEAPPGLSVFVDRLRIEQALGNLIDNALRHGDGEIRLSAQLRDGAVELHVTDRGKGFPPGFLDHAFERFSRADEGRGQGGAGIGLSIVGAIAEAHGGRAGAANIDGQGADVSISLPLKAKPDGSGNSHASPGAAAVPPGTRLARYC